MADAQYGEGRQFNLHSAGTDLVEGSALAVTSATGAIAVNGVTETGASAGVALMIGGGTPHDSVDSGNPIKIGGKAVAVASPVTDGDRVNAWFTLHGALNTRIVDSSGNALSLVDTQYVEDVALGATATGTLVVGRRDDILTTLTPVEGDAVGLRVNSMGALWSALHASDTLDVIAGDTQGASASAVGRFAAYSMVFNGTTWDRARSGGVTGMRGIAGATAADAAIAAYPVTIGGRASAATPTAMSADGDVVNAWFTTRGALNTRLVDANGDPISVGGGTQYTEDAALGATPTGTLSVAVGSTALPTAVSADGDAVGLWASLNGALNVIIRDTTGAAVATGTQYTEDVALAANAGKGTLVVARRDDALSTLTPVQDDAVGLRVGDKGALWVQIADGSGNQITSFGGGTQYVEDVALGATPTGTLSMAVGSAAKPTAVSADGDAVSLWATTSGALVVDGGIASDAPDSGAPLKIGGRAASSEPTAVSVSDRVDAWFGTTGALMVSIRGSTTGAGLDAQNVSTWLSSSGAASNPLPIASHLFNGTNWDRGRSIDGYKTAAAAPDVGLAAVGVADRRFTALSLGTVIGNTQTWDPTGAALAVVFVGTSTTGTFTFEVSADGTNWISADAWDIATETDISGTNLTPTANKVYRIKVAGYRSLRARTVATLGGAVSLTTTLTAWQTIQTPQGNVPHDSVDAGSPLKIGGRASSSTPTAVAGGDRANLWVNLAGAPVVSVASHGAGADGNGTNIGWLSVPAGNDVTALGVVPMIFNGTTMDRTRGAVTLADALANPGVGLVQGQNFLMGFNGTSWDRVRTANTGRLQVDVVTGGAGTQYTEDAAIGAVGTGIGRLSIGRANSSVPTSVSANDDAVGLWASRFGALNVILRTTSGVYVDLSSFTVNGDTVHDAVDSGSPVKMGGYASSAVPTAVSADADRVNVWMDRYGRQLIKQQSPTATLSNVASSATNVTVLAANTARLGATVFNDSTAILYLKMGATASTTSFTVKVTAGSYYEVPFGYSGVLDGIWDVATGNARVTELT